MDPEVDELDAAEALVAFGELRRVRDLAERDILVLAAHFADLYGVDADAHGRMRSQPGGQRALPLGGDGAPRVLEFAIAEIAGELAMTTTSVRRLVADAVAVRSRLPRLWARMYAGAVPPWRGLSPATATSPRPRRWSSTTSRRLRRQPAGLRPVHGQGRRGGGRGRPRRRHRAERRAARRSSRRSGRPTPMVVRRCT
jgi:hypothetical protein